jgi:hypothetical protein
MRIRIPGSEIFFTLDPGSEMEKFGAGIRNTVFSAQHR